MPWGDVSAAVELDEADNGGAGNGDFMAAPVPLFPRETIHVEFVRTDGASNDSWLGEIYASIDGVDIDSVPIATRRFEPATVRGSITLTGPPYVVLRIINGDPTPVDVVVVDVRWVKDQVNL